jgi:hypothetical protein
MKIAIIAIIVCLAVVVWLALQRRIRIATNCPVTSSDIPEILSQLERSGKNGNFAVLIFVPPGSTDGEAVNLQYSIEGGAVGLDWVLIGPRNEADREKVSEFAARLGSRLEEHDMNRVRYLRVTGSGIGNLGAKIITDFYHISADTKLDIVTEGFKWQPVLRAAA